MIDVVDLASLRFGTVESAVIRGYALEPGCDPPPLGEPIDDIRLQLGSDAYSLETTIELGDLAPWIYRVTASARFRVLGD